MLAGTIEILAIVEQVARAAALAVLVVLLLWRGRMGARVWISQNYVSVIGIFAVLLAPVWLFLAVLLVQNMTDLLAGDPGDDKRGHYYAVGILMTALGALLAAPFFVIKAWINERNTQAVEQGHITDRLTKAIEQLGAVRTEKRTETFRVRSIEYDLPAGEVSHRVEINQRAGEDPDIPSDAENVDFGEWQTSTTMIEETVPNLEVRLGAIYALERIAEDSERDHIAVMETLCAYIRENAPARCAKENPLPPFPDWPEEVNAEVLESREAMRQDRKQRLWEFTRSLPAPRVDIQAALTAIGRRKRGRIEMERRRKRNGDENDPGFQLDLRGTNLQKADLRHASFDCALLTEAHLEGAYLDGAHLEGAYLFGAHLEGAYLRGAHLEGAGLRWACLKSADLRDADFSRSSLGSADCTEAQHMSPEQVRSAFGVRAGYDRTLLPDDLSPPQDDPDWIDGFPAHWHVAEDAEEDGYELREAYRAAYEAWLATLDES